MDNFTLEMMAFVSRLSKPEKELLALYLEALDTMNEGQRKEFDRLVKLAKGLSNADYTDFMSGIVAAAWAVIDGSNAEAILNRWQDERNTSREQTRCLMANIVSKGLASVQ